MSDPISPAFRDFLAGGVTGPQEGGGESAFKSWQIPLDGETSRYGIHAPPGGSLTPVLSKSWLFEIVKRDSGIVQESFTLILPPTGISIKEPQRVSVTKTFGNAFVDDYGPDNLQITLKAESGTTHVFPTFATTGQESAFTDIAAAITGASEESSNTSGYTGKTAFYTFRERIIRYKNQEGWDNNELRVYDLADEQGYRCILLDFSLDRNAEKPLRYPFTISLFVYDSLDTPRQRRGTVINVSKEPITALDEADSLLDTLTVLFQDIKNVINQVALLNALSLELRTRYQQFLNQTTRLITSPLDVAKNMISVGVTAISALGATFRAGQYTRERYIQSVELLRQVNIEALKTYGFQISQGWQQTNTVDIEQDDGIDVSDPENTERAATIERYEYSGLQTYTVRGEDTLQSIALTVLGDENLWPYIAAVNSDISSNDDITPGQDLFVPIQIDPGIGNNKEQFILTEDVARDPYGTDIRIDDDGKLVVQENSDLATISGVTNVEQAINVRLGTEAGSLIKQTAFGMSIQAGLAGTDIAIKYLKIAIRTTLTQDPRIRNVTDMIVNINGDTVSVGMNINLIGIEDSLPVTLEV